MFAVMIKQGIALVQPDENDTVFCAQKSFLETNKEAPMPVISLHDDAILLHMKQYKYPSMVCFSFLPPMHSCCIILSYNTTYHS